MKKGQTSKRGGIEDFLCPFVNLYITQGAGGSYSHAGTMANDVNDYNGNTKLVPYYAPCTCKCVNTYPSSGQVMWISVDKVRCSNGYIGHVVFMTAHDNSMDSWIGQIVKQGSQLGNMGTKGFATGVHCHFEAAQTSDTTWKQNAYGIWCFNHEVDTDDMWFMDGTNILNMKTANWKYLKDVPVNTCPYKSKGAVKAIVNSIRVRTAPSTKKGDTGKCYNIDSAPLYYNRIVEGDGYYWAEYDRSVGGKGYCALCKLDGSSKYWNQI